MRLWSDSFKDGEAIPPRYAFGRAHPETHVQLENGDIIGAEWLGGGGAAGNGRAIVGSDVLSFFGLAMCENNEPCYGHIIPEIGPYPLTRGDTFSWAFSS